MDYRSKILSNLKEAKFETFYIDFMMNYISNQIYKIIYKYMS